MGELTKHRMPWEPVPPEETIAAMQRDMAYMVQFTAVLVHSNNDALSMLVNTPRGQIIHHGEVRFTNGTTVEFQDIGMPQPGAPTLSVPDLIARVWEIARELGLELQP